MGLDLPNHSRLSLWLMILLIPCLVGCEGCRSDRQTSQSDPEKSQDPFLSETMRTLPTNDDGAVGIKPLHWFSARQRIKSTQTDARGELRSRIRQLTGGIATSKDIDAKQPVILPKGQWREVEYRVLPRQFEGGRQANYFIENQLTISGKPVTLPEMQKTITPFEILQPQEFFFVVLTTRPERFARLQSADWVRFQSKKYRTIQSKPNFRFITVSDQGKRLPLPETILDWTSIAVVLWDDLPIEAVTPRQQQAIADWVHHGGRLILNGAEPTERLSYSALADLIPLELDSRIELDTDQAKNLLTNMNVGGDTTLEKQLAVLNQQAGGISFQGSLQARARYLPRSADLLASLPTGRGRVIQSRFDLTSEWIRNWGSYDSFFNSVILGRPRREIQLKLDELGEGFIDQYYPDYDTQLADPAFNTRFRITSRDALLTSKDRSQQVGNARASQYDSSTAIDSKSGIAGWRDDSDFIRLGIEVLRKQSGIPIPEAFSAITILLIYLLILIPLNYVIFRSLKRVEWFWIAIPCIAVIGAAVVARTIQLDIGFARSKSEIALLEIHGGYQRAHLTRLIAIYNSLTTDYRVAFQSRDAAVEPIALGQQQYSPSTPVLDFGSSSGLTLTDFPVQSNQVRMLRAEEMVNLGGTISLSEDGEITNQCDFGFRDAIAVRKSIDGRIQSALVGDLEPGQQKLANFDSHPNLEIQGKLSPTLSQLLVRLTQSEAMQAGTTRLIAWYDGVLDGLEMIPKMDQKSGQTLVVAHLRFPDESDPQFDINLASQFQEKLEEKSNRIDKPLREPAGDD